MVLIWAEEAEKKNSNLLDCGTTRTDREDAICGNLMLLPFVRHWRFLLAATPLRFLYLHSLPELSGLKDTPP
jgi:hypothetical protein